MNKYSLKKFKVDIRTNREFELIYKGKQYSLSISKEGYVFTDIDEEVYSIFSSYDELLKSVRIKGHSIMEIIENELYEDISIY